MSINSVKINEIVVVSLKIVVALVMRLKLKAVKNKIKEKHCSKLRIRILRVKCGIR